LTHVASAVRLDELNASQATVLAYVLIAGACLGFLGVLVAIRARGISTRAVIGCSVAAIALATLGPPLFSHDVYSYALYGRMWIFLHANPYVDPPSVAANDPFLHVASNGLRSVYGPLFTLISGLIVWVFRSPAAIVAAFKVFSGAAWIGVVVLAARLGRRKGPMQASFAAALVGLNPVVIMRVIAGGHNDALVALAIMAALTAWYDGHRLLVTAFLTLGMLVKVVTVIPLVIFLCAMVATESTIRDRLVTIGKHLAVVVALTAAALIPFGYSVRSISSFSTLTSLSNGSPRPPEVVIATASAHVLRSLGWARGVAFSDAVLQVAFLGVAAVALLLLLVRRNDRPIAEVVLLALLIFILCSRFLQPWYFAWFVPLIAFATRRRVIAIALALTLIAAETATAKSAGVISTWLGRFSYDVYPALALVFIVLLLAEVVRPLTSAAPET
jgi:alpha-1,6-mannosyltransferase